MKNIAMRIFVLVMVFVLSSPVFAINDMLKAQKVVNFEAVKDGIVKYSNIIDTKPTEDAYINRAFLNYLLGNYAESIADYDKLIEINPNNEEFFLNRGYLKHISHKRQEALKDYESALKIKPDYTFALNNKGVVLAELGQNEASMQAYDKAINIDPNYADAYYNRGNLKTRTEKNEEALEDFNTAIRLNPVDSASFNNRGVVKRKLNYNIGALSDFSIAIKLNPEDITAFANRGRLKKRYFDSEGAEEDFQSAIAVASESPTLVKEIEIAKAIEQAQEQARPALREPKVASDGIQKIAYNKTNQDDGVKTATVKASVVSVNPKQIARETALPATKLEKASEITTKPVENPQLAECYFIRALQKYILQNRQSALADFDMAIKYNPNYAEAYYYRAAIKRDFKDEGFVDDYRKAVQLNPSLKAVNEADVLTILKI